jgi:hypothetical protein
MPVPTFDIFRGSLNNGAIWIESADGLTSAVSGWAIMDAICEPKGDFEGRESIKKNAPECFLSRANRSDTRLNRLT